MTAPIDSDLTLSESPVRLIMPRRFGDARGWFMEVYNERTFHEAGITDRFVQDNHSMSVAPYTLRGLHYQAPPHGQAKLVRCLRGRIFDVAVDLRRGSPTFGRWVGAELSAENGNQFFVPVGFAHGFMTLEADCEVAYKVSSLYAPEFDGGIKWDDPAIGVEWPIPVGALPELSGKDAGAIGLADFSVSFDYDGRQLGGDTK
jgi:dTDP-4-dehydrorhamnose 3,5-epimerase